MEGKVTKITFCKWTWEPGRGKAGLVGEGEGGGGGEGVQHCAGLLVPDFSAGPPIRISTAQTEWELRTLENFFLWRADALAMWKLKVQLRFHVDAAQRPSRRSDAAVDLFWFCVGF